MAHEAILPEGWVKPKGYSNGILAGEGRVLFIAGQVGWSAEEKFPSEMLVPQFEQALKNILEIVKKAGAWFSYNEEKLGQGRDKSKEFLAENPALLVEIEKLVREKLEQS